MTEHPILFSGPMVQAIIASSKTQTRRVMIANPCHIRDIGNGTEIYGAGGVWTPLRRSVWTPRRCRYAVGDRLWVREAVRGEMYASREWSLFYSVDGTPVGGDAPHDWSPPRNGIREHSESGNNISGGSFPWWTCRMPSIHMPRWASRITLEITAIRVERLQAISEEDAIAEGVEPPPHYATQGFTIPGPKGSREFFMSAVEAFARMWDSINGNRPGCSWNDNPWVSAITFKRIRP